MNPKLIAPVLGVLMLGGSTLALADGWNHHDRGPSFHSWHGDVRDRADRHWNEYRDHRWYRPAPRAYVQPAPHWHPYGPYASTPRPSRDNGVTIILRSHVN